MQQNKYLQLNNSFTLIELLIVIGILAILTAAVVIVLNPTELLKQGRDSTRMTDLASLSKTIQTALTQDATASLGVSTTIAVSLPDTSATCANLGLPVLPAGYTYRCVTQANLTKTDGTGWIPYNFQTSGINMLSKIPLDPTNTTSTGLYYIFIGNQSTFQILSFLESNKYHHKAVQDAGTDPDRFEVGSTFSSWTIPSGLVGWWPLAQDSERLGGELHTNSGFESGSTGWNFDAKANGSFAVDADFFQGIGSARLTNATDNPIALWQDRSSSSGRRYQLSAYIRDINIPSTPYFSISGGSIISGSSSFSGISTTQWKPFSIIVQSNGTLVSPYIRTAAQGTQGSFLVDNFSIQEFKSGDISGNNNHGSFTKTIYTQNNKEENNRALNFNGEGSIDVSNNSTLNMTDKLTVSAWIKTATYEDFDSIAGKGTKNNSSTDSYLMDVVGGKIRYFLYTVSYVAPTGITTVADNTWHHVVMVYDGQFLKGYVDGTIDLNISKTGNIQTVSNNFYIGSLNNNSYFFNGLIADVRVYNRALSAAEILSIYNATK